MNASVWLLTIALLGAEGPQTTPSKRSDVAAQSATEASGSSSARRGRESRDVLLLLDSGPLHLRLSIGLGGVSLAEARRNYVARLMDNLDKNRDGKLTRDEANQSPILRTKTRPGAAAFLAGLGKQALQPFDVQKTIERLGGELVAYRQDLASSQNDQEVFRLLDVDRSGVLDASELKASADLIYSKDLDGDECVSFEEFFPPPPPTNPMLVSTIVPTTQQLPQLATVADMVANVHEPLMPRRLLKKYDRNRDLALSESEIRWPRERIKLCDLNGDGQLDVSELTRLDKVQPDIEMLVDLKAKDAGGGSIEIVSNRGKRVDEADRLDYAKVNFTPATVTFSHRNLEPIQSAVDNAMMQFNLLDLDANGYLDKDETALRIRFERGLFELMDADGDEKVFADEMKQYVAARAEPAATSCRINLYDTGNGFFMALDANADGRVSVREMRNGPGGLNQLDRDGQPGISASEPVRHFHVEFVRGSYQLFGPSEQLVAQTPAFQQRRPTGPIWFQRMDRNNDGDLTWNEFLGPREVFYRLDSDTDGLIDPQEAAKAE